MGCMRITVADGSQPTTCVHADSMYQFYTRAQSSDAANGSFYGLQCAWCRTRGIRSGAIDTGWLSAAHQSGGRVWHRPASACLRELSGVQQPS